MVDEAVRCCRSDGPHRTLVRPKHSEGFRLLPNFQSFQISIWLRKLWFDIFHFHYCYISVHISVIFRDSFPEGPAEAPELEDWKTHLSHSRPCLGTVENPVEIVWSVSSSLKNPKRIPWLEYMIYIYYIDLISQVRNIMNQNPFLAFSYQIVSFRSRSALFSVYAAGPSVVLKLGGRYWLGNSLKAKWRANQLSIYNSRGNPEFTQRKEARTKLDNIY